MEGSVYEPVIVAFLCNWCSYGGADLAGMSRIEYPANIRVIRVMCSSRVDPVHVLYALRMGADGVLVSGCHPGDCHYVNGNYRAERRFALLRFMLKQLGVEPERVRVEWVSSSEGERFARIVREFVEELRVLGPSPLKRFLGDGEPGTR
ncbi:MAG: hydrogenase iron-sulfur subunit [Candidatus Freyarchaeota archaeon]|nr:hydrogenase iron-sulfur subunit [Candidatus Freyrarchaeum guaymaensis]HDO80670.1 hydrogenase iron-sulfur subunit [Candidatus Bathyarchaeota archaeon]